jgi:hypothetical protein
MNANAFGRSVHLERTVGKMISDIRGGVNDLTAGQNSDRIRP